jgi:ketosteroid isomerase-like protein
MTTQAQIEGLRRTDLDFFAALLDRDIPSLELVLAQDFLIVDVASGAVHARGPFLEAIRAGLVSFAQIETFPLERRIRLVGPCTGIVIGRTAMSLKDSEGALTAVASRYTHVFQAQGLNWRLVSAQGTVITTASCS